MATGKFNEIELTWIKDMLDVHGEYVVDLLQEEIQKKKLIDSGTLESSLEYKTTQQGNNPKLSVSFMSYGRAIEIKYHSKNTRKFEQPNTNQVVWGIRNTKKSPKRKDARWYAKTAYGSLNRLIGILMSEFSDREIARIKNILQARQIRQAAIPS